MTVEEKDDIMKQISPNNYIGFSVKAEDTQRNREIHDWFNDASKKYAGHSYTEFLGILKMSFELIKSFKDSGVVAENKVAELVDKRLKEQGLLKDPKEDDSEKDGSGEGAEVFF